VPRGSEAPAALKGLGIAGSEAGTSVEMLGPQRRPQDISVLRQQSRVREDGLTPGLGVGLS